MYIKTVCPGLLVSGGTMDTEESHSVIDHFLRDTPDPSLELCLPIGSFHNPNDVFSDSQLTPEPPATNRERVCLHKPSKEAIRKKRWRDTLSTQRKEDIKKREREQKKRRFHCLSDEGRAEHRMRDRIRKARERNSETPEQKQERLARERLRKAMLRAKRKDSKSQITVQKSPGSLEKVVTVSSSLKDQKNDLKCRTVRGSRDMEEHEKEMDEIVNFDHAANNTESGAESLRHTFAFEDAEPFHTFPSVADQVPCFGDVSESILAGPQFSKWEEELSPQINKISEDLVADLFDNATFCYDWS